MLIYMHSVSPPFYEMIFFEANIACIDKMKHVWADYHIEAREMKQTRGMISLDHRASAATSR